MGKRARRKQQVRTRQARSSWHVLIAVVAVAVAGIALWPSTASQNTKPAATSFTYQFTTKEAEDLGNSLLAAVHPLNPENSYMPEFMKEKILWLYSEVDAKRILISFSLSNKEQEARRVAMQSFYQDGLPHIAILADRLIEIIRIQENTPSGFTRMQKNTFAMALVHEMVHLERPQEYFESPSKGVDPDEEFRTYSKVDQFVVVPLLKVNEPIEEEYRKIHEILVGCNYKMPCQAFVDYAVEGKR